MLNRILKFKISTLFLAFFFSSILPNPSFKIGYYSTWKIKCGIAQYTEHLHNALTRLGYPVIIFNNKMPIHEIVKKADQTKIKVFNIQYQKAIMPPTSVLINLINQLKKRKIKVIITIHQEAEDLKTIIPHVDHAIYHRPSKFFQWSSKIHHIPMGIPVFEQKLNKEQMRKKYGLHKDSVILSTVGFLGHIREYPEILELLTPWIKSNKKNIVQLLTSYSDMSPKGSAQEHRRIKQFVSKHNIGNQVVHLTSYLPQQELNERLWISDLGYLWINIQTNASSASGRDCIASRLPMVTVNSSHYHDLNQGVLKVPMNKTTFISTIMQLLKDPAKLKQLRNQLENLYRNFNYNNIIHRHIQIFMS